MGHGSCYHPFYFRNYPLANSVILMYDIKQKESLKECNYYAEKIKELCDEDIEVILLGNNQSFLFSGSTIEREREVSFEEGESFAKLNNYQFMEVSSETKEGVKEAGEIAIWMALKNKRKRDNLKLMKENNNKFKGKKNKNCLII